MLRRPRGAARSRLRRPFQAWSPARRRASRTTGAPCRVHLLALAWPPRRAAHNLVRHTLESRVPYSYDPAGEALGYAAQFLGVPQRNSLPRKGELLQGNDHPEEGGRQVMQLSAREASISEHPLVLRERVGITARGAGEHDQAERGRGWRRPPVLLGDELQRDGPATRLERCVDLAQQLLDGRRVEVMQEVREQHQVVVGPERDVERAAWQRAESLGDTRGFSILLCYCQNVRPVEPYHLGARVVT